MSGIPAVLYSPQGQLVVFLFIFSGLSLGSISQALAFHPAGQKSYILTFVLRILRGKNVEVHNAEPSTIA